MYNIKKIAGVPKELQSLELASQATNNFYKVQFVGNKYAVSGFICQRVSSECYTRFQPHPPSLIRAANNSPLPTAMAHPQNTFRYA